MRLRYAGRCRTCDVALPAGTTATYDRANKAVTCAACTAGPATPELHPAAVAHPIAPPPIEAAIKDVPPPAAVPQQVITGTAGESARREYQRRKSNREARIQGTHPRIGKFLLTVTDDPQSTKAWAVGARGEELLGKRLDGLTERGVQVLHDRRIPRTTANIDHIAVGPSGVFVIDAKRYQGRPSLRVEGGLFRPRIEKLMVGSHDCTKLVAGVHKQLDLVRAALGRAGQTEVPLRGMLCFVDGDWPLIGGSFAINDLYVLWPKRASEHLVSPGPFNDAAVQHLHRVLANAFPPA